MKELTYEDWKKNPTPREMWVWDSGYEGDKTKRVVIYMHPKESNEFNVIALESTTSNITYAYKHCAEIEKPKYRLMTNQELSWWLQDGKHREYAYIDTYDSSILCCNYFEYFDTDANLPVSGTIKIRENGGEWREPLVETAEYKDYLDSEKAYNDEV